MTGFASDFGNRAAGGWGKLESIFEDRVARALEKLGIPSAEEVAALQARVEALEAQLKHKDGAARPARTPRKTAARHPAEAAAKPSRRRKPSGDA